MSTLETAGIEELQLRAAALKTTPTGFAIAQPDGILHYVNEALVHLLGCEREELIGRAVQELWPDCPVPALDELAQRGPWRGEWQAPRKDGQLVVLDLSASLLTTEEGERRALILSATDSTARHRAEADLRLKDAVIANSVNAIVISDLAGGMFYVNDAFCKLLGMPREQLVGHSPRELWPEEADDVFETLAREGVFSTEQEIIRPDGTQLIVQVDVALVRDAAGQPTAIAAVVADLTERKRFEADLRLKDAAFTNAVNGIAIGDPSGTLLHVNDAFCKLLGVPREQIIGRTLFEFWPEQTALLVDGLHRQGFYRGDYSATTNDGRPVYFYIAASEVRDAAGEPTAVVVALADITARKRAEEELLFTNLLLATQQEATIDGILVVDGKGKVLSHNRRFAEIWGLSPEFFATCSDELLLQAVMDKLADPEEFITKVNYLYAHPQESSRDEVAFRDGRLLDRYSAPMIAADGQTYGRVWYFRDDTARRRAEHALAQRSRELERSNLELEQFAYVASHDLQEPLRMVSSYTQLLAKRYVDKLDKDANDFIEYAVSGANRMQRLINDLLSYSRVNTRGKAAGLVDSHAALGQAISNLSFAIEESGAIITNDELPVVLADDLQLAQVFQNLIGNAIKFRREEPPRVHISASRAQTGWTFAVRDNGAGIAPEYYQHIFQIFQRLHTKQCPGTGIGLALCKRIVERHGGEIWVESVPNQGSTFYFTLPG